MEAFLRHGLVVLSFMNYLGIDGQVVMKHIFGIRARGTKIRIRKESKVFCLPLPSLLPSLSNYILITKLLAVNTFEFHALIILQLLIEFHYFAVHWAWVIPWLCSLLGYVGFVLLLLFLEVVAPLYSL